MNLKIKLLLLFILLFFVQSIYSLEITAIKAEGYFRGEHTRASHYSSEISAIGAVELNEKYTLRCGISIGRTLVDTSLDISLNANYSPFLNLPLCFSAIYFYNTFLEYHIHTHSIFPFISYNTDRAGISAGINFRFSRFFGEKAQFESIFTLLCYFTFINNDMLTLRAGFGNFNEFNGKNFGAFSYYLNAQIRLSDNLRLINQIELMQSGIDGLSATFFGMAFRLGVRYIW